VEDNYKERQEVFSKKIKAGKRRTYFFDVRATKANDYYLIITESKKRFDSDQYERHKIFLYKEDFHKFIKAMEETVNYIKTELLPDYNFDEFDHSDNEDGSYQHYNKPAQSESNFDEVEQPTSLDGMEVGTPDAVDDNDADLEVTEQKKPEDEIW
jgi:hypothetical protein